MKNNEENLMSSVSVQQSKTEGYLKKIAKNAGITAAGNVIGFISSPISGIITTRALGAEFYGIYTLATYWTNLLSEISRVGLGGTTIRFVAAYKGEGRLDKAKGVILLSLKTGLIIGSLFTIFMILFPEPFCSLVIKRPDAASAFRFFSFNILLTAIYGTFIAGLTGFQEQRYVVLANSVFGDLVKIGSLILLLSFGLKLYGALASSLLQDIIILFLSGIFLLRVFPGLRKRTIVPVTEGKKLWKFSGTIFATSLFRRYTFQLDLMFLGLFRSVTEVGLYAVALKLQPVIYMPHYAIMQIFGPIVAELYVRKDIQEIGSLYKTVTKWTASFSIPIFLTIVFFYDPILGIFGKEFHGAAASLLILSFGNIFHDILGISGQVITMIGKPVVNLINSLITTVAIILLFLLLIPQHGIIGAAIAYTISNLFINTLQVIQVYSFLKIHPFKKTLWKVFCSAIASLIAVFLLQSVSSSDVAWFFQLIFLWVVYVFMMWLLKLDEEDIVVLRVLKHRIMR